MAERVGFEPTVPFWSTQHFQCCTFGRSVTSPEGTQCNPDASDRAMTLYESNTKRDAF